MAWTITGDFIEACSCNMLCPCWYGEEDLMIMDQGWCASPWLIRIRQGQSEDVDLSGRVVVIATFLPGPTLLDGNGTSRIYLEDKASDAEAQELEAIFQAKKGGPMEVLASLVTTWLPTVRAPITVDDTETGLTATVGDYGEIVSRRMINEAGDPVTMKGANFALAWRFKDAIAELAPSDGTRWADPDLPLAWDGHSGAIGHFTWAEA